MPTTTTPTTILPTECLTFPRSGNHLLHDLLDAYFADALAFCDIHQTPERALDRDPATNVQKNHDLNHDTPLHDDRRYIVQVRYPIDSITSWYRMACDNGYARSPGAWQSYAIQQLANWMMFYRRWVLRPVPMRIVIAYADLVDRPTDVLARVVEHLTAAPPDTARVEQAVSAFDIRRRNNPEGFEFHDRQFFGLLNALLATTPGLDHANRRVDPPADSACA